MKTFLINETPHSINETPHSINETPHSDVSTIPNYPYNLFS